MLALALLAAVSPALAGAPPRAAAGPDPWGTRMVASLGLGPWSTLSGKEDGSFSPYFGGGSGTYVETFAGGEFRLPASFELNADGLGAAFDVGYASGAGVWTDTVFGGRGTITSSRIWLSGEFDFALPIRSGVFFGVGPALHLGSRTERQQFNCGQGFGIGSNEVSSTTALSRIGGAARLRMWMNRNWALRANAQLLLIGFGSQRYASTCPGSGAPPYDAGLFAPVFAAEVGAAYRVNRLFSVAADLGFRYERYTASHSELILGTNYTHEFIVSHLGVYVVPRITAQLNF